MSTEATTAAVAPAEAVPAPSTETPQAPATDAPQTAREARQRVQDRRAGRYQPSVAEQVNGNVATVDDRGRGHGPDGKFTGGTFPAASQEPAAEPQSENPTAETATAEAATAPKAEDRIALPDGHPLRDRGRQFVDELTPAEIRSLINTPIKNREVEQARQQAMEAQRELLQLRKQVEALREQRTGLLSNPDIAARYAELQAWNPDEANRWLRGLEAEYEAQIGAKQQEADSEFQQIEARQRGEQFASETYQEALSAGYPEWFLQETLMQELGAYGSWVEFQRGTGNKVVPNRQDVLKRLRAAYFEHPHVQQHLNSQLAQQKQAERVQVQQEAEEAQKRKLEESLEAQKRTNPMGRVPNVATGQTVPVSGGAKSFQQARQAVRDRRMGRG